MNRIVVQPGRTLRSGRRGRWFESSHFDQVLAAVMAAFFIVPLYKILIKVI